MNCQLKSRSNALNLIQMTLVDGSSCGMENHLIIVLGVEEYRTDENDKTNYLCPGMEWPIMCAAGTGRAYQ